MKNKPILYQPVNNFEMIINNHLVSYTDAGKEGAPVIIFIHGFPFNRSMWNFQVESLKDYYHLITYDIRGHGNSDAGNEDFSIDLFVSDLIGLMDALKIDRAILCGLSMGGYIALNAAEKYSERFDAIILADTQCIADTPEAKEKRIKAIESIREYGVEKYAEESIKNLFAYDSFTTKLKEIEDVRDMIMKTPEQSLISALLALSGRKETCNILPEIKVPVLIMVGKEDKLTPPSAATFMHERIKGSLLRIIDNAGHLSNLENPGVFTVELKKFIASVYSIGQPTKE
jgi:3-oxoadipate enol-lactonase